MTKSDYFKRQVLALYNNCIRGKLHFHVWEDLNNRLKNDEKLYSKYSFFWVTTLKSHLESVHLHVVKLFDTPKNTIKINRVVEYAEDNKSDLFNTDKIEAVEIHINEFKSDIGDYQNQIDTLKNIRNLHFVHLSKEYVGKYDSLYTDYVKIRKDMIHILLICGDILEVFLELGYEEYNSMNIGVEYQTGELLSDLSKCI